jgi:hypothetical protein
MYANKARQKENGGASKETWDRNKGSKASSAS